jgi:hypothetical protein
MSVSRSEHRFVFRRRFLGACTGIVGDSILRFAAAGQRRAEIKDQHLGSELRFKLLREFKNTSPHDISPDGRYVCLGIDHRRGRLQVAELESGRVIYNTQLREDLLFARFFADGEILYAQTSLIDESSRYRRRYQQAVIDLKTGKLATRLCDFHFGYFPLATPFLLSDEHNSLSQGVTLSRVTLPEYSETARASFAPFQRRYPNDPDNSPPAFSADRKRVVHQVDHTLVCRSTEDLSVIWTRPVEPDYHWGAWHVDMTQDGRTVVAAVIDQSALHPQRFYVGVYDGTDGSVLARHPISAAMGVSISPDGKLIAVGDRAVLPDGRIEPTVNVYEALTGVQVGKVRDPPVAEKYSRAGISGQFTGDGKYLVTAGRGMKVWALD